LHKGKRGVTGKILQKKGQTKGEGQKPTVATSHTSGLICGRKKKIALQNKGEGRDLNKGPNRPHE